MLIKSETLSAASGDLNGLHFRPSRYGLQITKKPTRIVSRSDEKNLVTLTFRYLQALWHDSLTDAQKHRWTVYADHLTRTNAIGTTYKMTGSQTFTRRNFNAIYYWFHSSKPLPLHSVGYHQNPPANSSATPRIYPFAGGFHPTTGHLHLGWRKPSFAYNGNNIYINCYMTKPFNPNTVRTPREFLYVDRYATVPFGAPVFFTDTYVPGSWDLNATVLLRLTVESYDYDITEPYITPPLTIYPT